MSTHLNEAAAAELKTFCTRRKLKVSDVLREAISSYLEPATGAESDLSGVIKSIDAALRSVSKRVDDLVNGGGTSGATAGIDNTAQLAAIAQHLGELKTLAALVPATYANGYLCRVMLEGMMSMFAGGDTVRDEAVKKWKAQLKARGLHAGGDTDDQQ